MFYYDIPDRVMKQAVHKYIDGEYNQQLISTSMNGVYEITSEEKKFILRFSHLLKKESQIQAEIDFIRYLSKNGANVVKPLLSKRNTYVEHVDIHQKYTICAFEKAAGKIIDARNNMEWNDKLFQSWGKIMGKMHKLTKAYIPANQEYKRPEWNEELLDYENSIFNPNLILWEGNETVFHKWRELLRELSMLPKDKDSYGLIHCDLHSLNFFVSEGEITAFDFDDCCYHWFAYDIAIAFYDSLYGIPIGERKQRKEFIRHFSDCFLEGYHSENSLSEEWIKRIPLFIKYRDYLLYMVTVAHSKRDEIDPEQKQLLDYIRQGLDNDSPYVDFD